MERVRIAGRFTRDCNSEAPPAEPEVRMRDAGEGDDDSAAPRKTKPSPKGRKGKGR